MGCYSYWLILKITWNVAEGKKIEFQRKTEMQAICKSWHLPEVERWIRQMEKSHFFCVSNGRLQALWKGRMSVFGKRELSEYWGDQCLEYWLVSKEKIQGWKQKVMVLKWSSENRQEEQQSIILEEPSRMHENSNSLREWEYYFIEDLLCLQVSVPPWVLEIIY